LIQTALKTLSKLWMNEVKKVFVGIQQFTYFDNGIKTGLAIIRGSFGTCLQRLKEKWSLSNKETLLDDNTHKKKSKIYSISFQQAFFPNKNMKQKFSNWFS